MARSDTPMARDSSTSKLPWFGTAKERGLLRVLLAIILETCIAEGRKVGGLREGTPAV